MPGGRRAFTGAWIETRDLTSAVCDLYRRAFTGAWIETPWRRIDAGSSTVAPSRARGLKLAIGVSRYHYRGRAFTGAWIETLSFCTGSRNASGRAFTGAWIETGKPIAAPVSRRSSRLHGRVD